MSVEEHKKLILHQLQVGFDFIDRRVKDRPSWMDPDAEDVVYRERCFKSRTYRELWRLEDEEHARYAAAIEWVKSL